MSNFGGVVVLEGPDAAGKTTLAYELLDGDLNGYVHLSYSTAWSDRYLWELQMAAMLKAAKRLSEGKLTVIDRHWISALYQKVYFDKYHLVAEARGWDRVLQRLCACYVICAPSPTSVMHRHAKEAARREEMYKPDARMGEVARRYWNLWYGNPTTVEDYSTFITDTGGFSRRDDAVLYDIDTHGSRLDVVIDEIKSCLARRIVSQYSPALVDRQRNFVGHVKDAEFVFVGERFNTNKPYRLWPFIDFGGCSRFISEVLQELRFDERRAVWTNAHSDSGDCHLEALAKMRSLKPLTFIALGASADEVLDDMGIPHYKLNHPSYAQRFNRSELFKEQLRRIFA